MSTVSVKSGLSGHRLCMWIYRMTPVSVSDDKSRCDSHTWAHLQVKGGQYAVWSALVQTNNICRFHVGVQSCCACCINRTGQCYMKTPQHLSRRDCTVSFLDMFSEYFSWFTDVGLINWCERKLKKSTVIPSIFFKHFFKLHFVWFLPATIE